MMEKIICPYCQDLLTEKYYCVHCEKDFSTEVQYANEWTLPEEQIAQQDYVDNLCFDLLKEFIPDCDWDIHQISIIRNALIDVLTKFHGGKEYNLYPWLLESELP